MKPPFSEGVEGSLYIFYSIGFIFSIPFSWLRICIYCSVQTDNRERPLKWSLEREGGGVLEKFHFWFKTPSDQALTRWSSSDRDHCTAVVFVSLSTHCCPAGSFGNWFLSLHQWPRKLIIVAPSSQSSNGLTHTHIQI